MLSQSRMEVFVGAQESNLVGELCHYCGRLLTHTFRTQRTGDVAAGMFDHVIPRSRGGTDDPVNLVPCCHLCNASKHDRTIEEWRALILPRIAGAPKFSAKQVEWLLQAGFDYRAHVEARATLLFYFEDPDKAAHVPWYERYEKPTKRRMARRRPS